MSRITAIGALLLCSGCATLTEPVQQEVMVQTIQDHRPLFGAGCILFNNVGKWFVTTPARVSIQKSPGPLHVDCRKDGAGWASETIPSRVNSALWSNLALTAGVGLLVDHNTGAGFDYPATLTIVLRPIGEAAPAPAEAATPVAAPAGSALY